MLKPRIEDMNGKVDQIEIIQGVKIDLEAEAGFSLTTDLGELESLVKEFKPDLVLLDPLVSYTTGVDPIKGDEVRRFLDPVVRLAATYNFALVGVIHLNKAETKALYKIVGSTQYAAVARRSRPRFSPDHG
jgi:RecA-family ATPase